jgi:hypothetical protein
VKDKAAWYTPSWIEEEKMIAFVKAMTQFISVAVGGARWSYTVAALRSAA